MAVTLGEVAEAIGAALLGDPGQQVVEIAPLDQATAEQISFLSSDQYLSHLETTAAVAVILQPQHQDQFSGNRLLVDDPYLGYARTAALLHPEPSVQGGQHPTAVVDPSAQISEQSWIGPQSVVMAGTVIEASVEIAPGCLIGPNCRIGKGSRLKGQVTLMEGTVLGEECLLHPGAVLGSDGFGFANDRGCWVKIPQLGRVVVGNRVEIGANSTIDRGALEDTVIEDGVKIDNLVHLAHNVRIGENSAMAAMVGVAGSTDIGPGCTFGGQAGVVGHLQIAAGTHCSARTLVTRSIDESGSYSSGMPATPSRNWRRNMVQLRNLNQSIQRLKSAEKRIDELGTRLGDLENRDKGNEQ